MKLVPNLRQIRELKGFTQEYMAAELKMSQNGYSKIERGETNVTLKQIEQIAIVLNIQPEELLNFDGSQVFISNNHKNQNSFFSISPSMDTVEKERLHNEILMLRKEIEHLNILHEKTVEGYEKEISYLKELLSFHKTGK